MNHRWDSCVGVQSGKQTFFFLVDPHARTIFRVVLVCWCNTFDLRDSLDHHGDSFERKSFGEVILFLLNFFTGLHVPILKVMKDSELLLSGPIVFFLWSLVPQFQVTKFDLFQIREDFMNLWRDSILIGGILLSGYILGGSLFFLADPLIVVESSLMSLKHLWFTVIETFLVYRNNFLFFKSYSILLTTQQIEHPLYGMIRGEISLSRSPDRVEVAETSLDVSQRFLVFEILLWFAGMCWVDHPVWGWQADWIFYLWISNRCPDGAAHWFEL